MGTFEAEIRRYELELPESVEPFWRRLCPDPEFGGYFTCLDRDGSVCDTEKFMWMQWRIDEWTWARFPDPAYGEWFGYLDRRGEPSNLLKGGRWKSLFHLPRCPLVAAARMHACR
jgi:mannose/cellobiose epimerase-like protein (N-acyl-D-glucosamine 2-epimerase family)